MDIQTEHIGADTLSLFRVLNECPQFVINVMPSVTLIIENITIRAVWELKYQQKLTYPPLSVVMYFNQVSITMLC